MNPIPDLIPSHDNRSVEVEVREPKADFSQKGTNERRRKTGIGRPGWTVGAWGVAEAALSRPAILEVSAVAILPNQDAFAVTQSERSKL